MPSQFRTGAGQSDQASAVSEIPDPARPNTLLEGVHGSAVHAALEAILTVDEKQRIVMINPAALRMFGCTAAEAIGSKLSRFIPARHRAAHENHVRRFDASGVFELSMGSQTRIVGLRANGEEFPAEATVSSVDVAGEFGPRRYFTALLRDVSNEQGLKVEIDALNRRMRAVLELAPIAIWFTDGDRIVFANRACATLFGTTDSATLIGRSIYSLFGPASQSTLRQTVVQALTTDTPIPVTGERIVRLDGAMRDVEIAVAALPDHGQTALQMVITDITERAREHEELERSRRELRRLSAGLIDAREEERRRIARELHDELGQRLTALKMELSSLATPERYGAPDKRVAAMLEMVDDTVASVRRIATDLRPMMLDDLGLNAAIEWLARDSARRMGIEISLELGDADPPISAAATIAVYRMVQEALTNIARHAKASAVHVQLRCEPDELLLVVRDDGIGFDEQAMHREGSHGLMGIRERARLLGGHLEIGNAPGGGGRIAVRLPMLRAASATENQPLRNRT